MSVREKIQLVAVDDGYDFTKVVTKTNAIRIPTAYSLKPGNTIAVMGDPNDQETVYEIEGVQYAVGPDVATCDTRFEEFPYHPANLAIAIDAIRRAVEPGAAVHVIVGLPLSRFYLPTGEQNTSVAVKKTAAWSKLVKAVNGSPVPRIIRVSVIAEAVAAWFDHVIDDNFVARQELLHDFMAVVDIGGRTTDIAVFQKKNMKGELSGTLNSGVLAVQEKIEKLLAAKLPDTEFSRSELIEAMRTKKVELGNSSIDVSKEVLDAKRSLVSQIDVFMKSKFGSQMPKMKRILFVGGGAEALWVELKERFPNAVFAPDPQMANARGMLKFAIAVAELEEEQMPAA